MECQHDRVYVRTFEAGRVLWICRLCAKTGSDVDDGDPSCNFDTDEYFRVLTDFNDRARDRARSRRTA